MKTKVLAIIFISIMAQGCLWGSTETNAVKTVVTTGLVTNSGKTVSDDILKAKELEAKTKAAEAGKDNKANIAITDAIKRLPIDEQGEFIRLALVLLFIAEAIVCVYLIVSKYLQNVYITYSLFCVFSSLFLVGLEASIVTSLQLGLDQMPEASSSSITAFIAWYIFSTVAGLWIADIVITCLVSCISR